MPGLESRARKSTCAISPTAVRLFGRHPYCGPTCVCTPASGPLSATGSFVERDSLGVMSFSGMLVHTQVCSVFSNPSYPHRVVSHPYCPHMLGLLPLPRNLHISLDHCCVCVCGGEALRHSNAQVLSLALCSRYLLAGLGVPHSILEVELGCMRASTLPLYYLLGP